MTTSPKLSLIALRCQPASRAGVCLLVKGIGLALPTPLLTFAALGCKLRQTAADGRGGAGYRAFINADETPRRLNANRSKLYPDALLRPASFAIPEHFEGRPDDYRKAKFGPFSNINERY